MRLDSYLASSAQGLKHATTPTRERSRLTSGGRLEPRRARIVGDVSAEPLPLVQDPDEPSAILQALPTPLRGQFLAEYTHAVDKARDPAHYPALRDLLRTWRLHALAIADPGYSARLAAARGDDPAAVSLDDITSTRSAG